MDFENAPRCPVPVVFLDTHVISNMAKWKMGPVTDSVTLRRASSLYERIHRLVQVKKAICPEVSTWADEYRLKSRIGESCEKMVVDLSQGISLRSPNQVENCQMQIAMEAYVQRAKPVDYSKEWAQMYYQSPIAQLLDETPFVLRLDWAHGLGSHGEMRARKKRLKDKLAGIKKADSSRTPSFEQKLEEEYQGYIRGMYKLGLGPLGKSLIGQSPTPEEGLVATMTLGMHLVFWEKANGTPAGVTGLAQFYGSEYFRSVPRIEITAKLWAAPAVYLKRAKAKGSDAADIDMISTVLPYADLLVLDKTMADLVRDRLHLDEQYDVTVFDLSDFDELVSALEALERRDSPLKDMPQ